MPIVRIALANVREPMSPAESVKLAIAAIEEASREGAQIICFPECFVPGYRWAGRAMPPPDDSFLQAALVDIGHCAA